MLLFIDPMRCFCLWILILHIVAGLRGLDESESDLQVIPPKESPIQGDYTGRRRPQIHFSSPRGFMNDPNGFFVDKDGLYHLYYQYNPTGLTAGNAHWGHATSSDLYHWTNEPIALFPSTDREGIFTGSIVVDANNTSGFFPNQTNGVVAFYTLHTPEEQTQDLAYSLDGGYTFTKYSGNPVISIGSTEFRDPKVIWHPQTSKWVAVIAYAKEYTIGIFTSPDLKSWQHASNFSHAGLLGLHYECPNLVPIPMLRNASATNPFDQANFIELQEEEPMWVLLVSINPNAPQGGSTSQYFPGTFNGTHFSPVDQAVRLADFGKDNYAGQFLWGIASKRPQISIAWASNWQYTNLVPTADENFRGTMSLPRINVLANITRSPYTLLSAPVPLSNLHTTKAPLLSSLLNSTSSITLPYGPSSLVPSSLDLRIQITALPPRPHGSLSFTFRSTVTNETLRGGVLFEHDFTVWIDRGSLLHAFNEYPLFTDKFSTAHEVDPETRSLDLQIVLDGGGLVECFVDGGARSATVIYFAEGVLDLLEVRSEGLDEGVEAWVEVWGLKSVWEGGKKEEGRRTNGKADVKQNAGVELVKDEL